MILRVYSVYDLCAKAYIPPFFMVNDNMAIRAFSNAANDESHQFGKNAGDYTLFCIGEFDDVSGELTRFGNFVKLGCALQFMEN